MLTGGEGRGRRKEEGRRKKEDGGRRTEDGGQGGEQRLANGGWQR
jgi:hypothetical protein